MSNPSFTLSTAGKPDRGTCIANGKTIIWSIVNQPTKYSAVLFGSNQYISFYEREGRHLTADDTFAASNKVLNVLEKSSKPQTDD